MEYIENLLKSTKFTKNELIQLRNLVDNLFDDEERKEIEKLEVFKNESYRKFKKRIFDNSQFIEREKLNSQDYRDYYSHCINFVLDKFCWQMNNLDRPSGPLNVMIGQPNIIFCDVCFSNRKEVDIYYDHVKK